MLKQLVVVIGCLLGLMTVGCRSDKVKATEAVKEFCEANASGMSDKVSALYPDFKSGYAKTSQVDQKNLEAIQSEDGVWKVEDGASHTFFITNQNGKFIIKDTKNVIEIDKSQAFGHELAASIFGMTSEQSTDLEVIRAYNMLNNGSDLINFLNNKYPQAKTYGIEVQDIRKKREGGMGIYWLEVKAILKSGAVKPLGAVNVNFIFKDKDGNVVYKRNSIANLDKNDIKDVDSMVDLSDYPNVTDVDVELTPFGNRSSRVSDIELLCSYAKLSKTDYQEFINQR